MWLYIVGAIFLLLVAILASPIVIAISLGEELHISLSFWFVKVRIYPRPKKAKGSSKRKQTKESPKQEKKDKPKASGWQQVKQVFGVLGILFKAFWGLLKNAKVKKLKLTLGITGEDAAIAAITYGRVCGVVYPFLGLVDNHMRLINPQVNVYCDYLGDKSVIEGSGKVYITVFHALVTGLKALFQLIQKNIKK